MFCFLYFDLIGIDSLRKGDILKMPEDGKKLGLYEKEMYEAYVQKLLDEEIFFVLKVMLKEFFAHRSRGMMTGHGNYSLASGEIIQIVFMQE